MPSVAVIVLGDVGHSPRMAYHTLSLAEHNINVHLVGYTASQPHPAIRNHPRVHITGIPTWPWSWLTVLPFIIAAPIKALLQTATLLFTLLFALPRDVRLFLLQTPPAVPALPIAVLASRIRGIPLVVDWHNLGYTILALRFTRQQQAPLVRLYRFAEAWCAPLAHSHFCVSKAFAEFLLEQFGIAATVVYDRPHALFTDTAALSLQDRHALFTRIMPDRCTGAGSMLTPFTAKTGEGEFVLRRDRPLLLVSSTSWTKDEDFGMLLNALRQVRTRYPSVRIHAVITGKGPEKAAYEDRMAEEGLLPSKDNDSSITVETAWLRAEDYPRLLAAADLGVCLHRSSSGVDLPMKVIDMYGAGLPVCAVAYPALSEQVKHGDTGLIFQTDEELAKQLMELGSGFPTKTSKLDHLRNGVSAKFLDPKQRWSGHWEETAWCVMEPMLID